MRLRCQSQAVPELINCRDHDSLGHNCMGTSNRVTKINKTGPDKDKASQHGSKPSLLFKHKNPKDNQQKCRDDKADIGQRGGVNQGNPNRDQRRHRERRLVQHLFPQHDNNKRQEKQRDRKREETRPRHFGLPKAKLVCSNAKYDGKCPDQGNRNVGW